MYIAALVCRDTLGRSDIAGVREEFDSVPRSIFLVFRCTFGDCSTVGGAPIFGQVANTPGGRIYCILYGLYVFFVSVGLFNIIAAIFVNNTMEAAQNLQLEALRER